MKTKVQFILTFLCFFSGLSITIAQQTEISGTVKDAKGKKVANAIIYVDGVNTYVKTNTKGYFNVPITAEAQVVSVYSEKHGLLSALYEGQKSIDFIFLDNETDKPSQIKSVEEKISVGYDEVNAKDVAYSVGTYKADRKKPDSQIFDNIFEMVRGRVKGVTVTGNNKIIVRGVSTLTGVQEPLFVVNGQIVDNIDFVRPVDVDSIDFLKDGSGSIYGSRAANGVLIIKLKS